MPPNTVTRAHVIRTIAASLCFDQDPPVLTGPKQLERARTAAAGITQALADSGVIVLAEDGNGADVFTPAPSDEPPLPLEVD